MTGYYLHAGPSTLPRRHRRPMSLMVAVHRAYGLRYAVIYRLADDGRPVPVLADAGNHRELLHVPSSRRLRRDGVGWRVRLAALELAEGVDPGDLAGCDFGDDRIQVAQVASCLTPDKQ